MHSLTTTLTCQGRVGGGKLLARASQGARGGGRGCPARDRQDFPHSLPPRLSFSTYRDECCVTQPPHDDTDQHGCGHVSIHLWLVDGGARRDVSSC